MLRDGFLRFCDDPDIACCQAEAELGKLRIENGQLYAELAELQELAQAKADGRLVVLSCKVGDIVYANCYGEVIGWEIHQIEMRTGEPTQYIACGNDEGYGAAEIDFTGEDIGKTVFLTREEAEKALQEGSACTVK